MLLRLRFWIEIGLGALSVATLALTVAWPEWIEALFGVDPDGGDGSLEWAIVGALAICTVTLPLLARREWRHAHRALPAPRVDSPHVG
jgi:hypothetical protein